MNARDILRKIDQTCLKGDDSHFASFLESSATYPFRSLCVRPERLTETCEHLIRVDSAVRMVTVVINFPVEKIKNINDVGGDLDNAIAEVEELFKIGAKYRRFIDLELDFVAKMSNISKKLKYLVDELICYSLMSDTAIGTNVGTKIIIESGLLTDRQLDIMGTMVYETGHDFLKSSTGYYKTGFEYDRYEKFIKKKPRDLQVKASGGLKTLDDTKRALDIGVDVIGMSNGLGVASELGL